MPVFFTRGNTENYFVATNIKEIMRGEVPKAMGLFVSRVSIQIMISSAGELPKTSTANAYRGLKPKSLLLLPNLMA